MATSNRLCADATGIQKFLAAQLQGAVHRGLAELAGCVLRVVAGIGVDVGGLDEGDKHELAVAGGGLDAEADEADGGPTGEGDQQVLASGQPSIFVELEAALFALPLD